MVKYRFKNISLYVSQGIFRPVFNGDLVYKLKSVKFLLTGFEKKLNAFDGESMTQ